MKAIKFLLLILLTSLSTETFAQFGMGGMGMGRNPYTGRRQSLAPQGPVRQDEPENLTAEQIVDLQMDAFKEALDLSAFEVAVLRTILVNSVQKRIELQLLKLTDVDQKRAAVEKIDKEQEEALKSGLPADKYDAFIALQEEGFKKNKKKKKKRKKNKS